MKLRRTMQFFAFASAITFSSLGLAAGLSYSQNFEGLDRNNPNALADDGWQVGGIVYESNGDFAYDYFAFPAPNVTDCTGPGFSCILSTAISSGLDGPNTGSQWLNVYNDYNNADHTNGSGRSIEAHTFLDLGTVAIGDVGSTVSVSFDARLFNIAASTSTIAFAAVKVLDSVGGSFSILGIDSIDMLGSGVTTSGWTENLTLSLIIDSAWVGQLVQLDFTSLATASEPSGIFYDNIDVSLAPVPVPAAAWLFASALGLLGWMRRR